MGNTEVLGLDTLACHAEGVLAHKQQAGTLLGSLPSTRQPHPARCPRGSMSLSPLPLEHSKEKIERLSLPAWWNRRDFSSFPLVLKDETVEYSKLFMF